MDEVLLMVKERKGAASRKFESQENFRSAHKKKASIGGEPTQSYAVENAPESNGGEELLVIPLLTNDLQLRNMLLLIKCASSSQA